MEARKILIVDDEARMRKLVKDFLLIKGYRVLEAADGEQAVEMFFQDKEIDLIILDIMMPRMDGYEFTRALRESNNNLPILMVSAKQLPSDKNLMRQHRGKLPFLLYDCQSCHIICKFRQLIPLSRCHADVLKEGRIVLNFINRKEGQET